MSEKPSSVPASLNKYAPSGGPERGYPALHDHVLGLQRKGLLRVVDEPINKDTEMHALVRWHSRGGIPEADRKAFLFTQPTDSKDKRYDSAVVVAGLAGTPDVYRLGFGQPLDAADQRLCRHRHSARARRSGSGSLARTTRHRRSTALPSDVAMNHPLPS